MNLFQDRTQTLEKMERECQDRIASQRKTIEEVDTNIALLKQALSARADRFSYYKSFQESMLSDTNRHAAGGAGKNTGGRGSAGAKPKGNSTQKDKSKASGFGDGDAGASSMGLSMGSFAGGVAAARRSNLQQTAFNQYLIANGANREEVKQINETILELIERARDKDGEVGFTENRSKYLNGPELIAQLKKIEMKFNELVEKRQVFSFFDRDTLFKEEKSIKQNKHMEKMEVMKEKMK